MQAPTIAAAIPARCKVLILTANESSFMASKGIFLSEAGIVVDNEDRFIVNGLQAC